MNPNCKLGQQLQLDKLSHYIEEHFPGHYAEHLAEINRKGLGDRAILIMQELKMRIDAVNSSNIELQKQLKKYMDREMEADLPPIPPPPGYHRVDGEPIELIKNAQQQSKLIHVKESKKRKSKKKAK